MGAVSPTVKHLYNGFDVTLFAYGVTGTGKTHTMRGGKTLADRGVIPRLLSSIYRRGRKIEKDSSGSTQVSVAMSYYEIYNDKVYDLFEPPEQRSAVGLPIRDNGGKAVVCGLTERPCSTLKEFESLYDAANVNRSTAGTKLNAHSSRSHAILCVKVSQVSEDRTIVSTASAIDLAGSEDNRRTDNGKERLVESSAINRSLFVLAQCVEAISKKQHRIPYRESKMTRILALGQNNGLTVMILNLAPVRSYHLDTLSSLNFANRTKKIEVREVENEPLFRGPAKGEKKSLAGEGGRTALRQPLRPLPSATNTTFSALSATDKPVKSFPVFSERNSLQSEKRSSLKRPSDSTTTSIRPPKMPKSTGSDSLTRRHLPPTTSAPKHALTQSQIEDLVTRMVDERLASRPSQPNPPKPTDTATLPADIRSRLEALESRVSAADGSRAEGLQFLLMAKQLTAHGELASALRMYRLALPFFPDNERLASKMLALQRRIAEGTGADDADASFVPDEDNDDDERPTRPAAKTTRKRPSRVQIYADDSASPLPATISPGSVSPRTAHILRILNTRDLAQIRSLKGVGAKKAEAIVNALVEMEETGEREGDLTVRGLEGLGVKCGLGGRAVENMRRGVVL